MVVCKENGPNLVWILKGLGFRVPGYAMGRIRMLLGTLWISGISQKGSTKVI